MPKAIDWEKRGHRKHAGQRLSSILNQWAETQVDAKPLANCANWYLMGQLENGKQITEGVMLCKSRLCPTCRHIRAMAWQQRLDPIFNAGHITLDGNRLVFAPHDEEWLADALTLDAATFKGAEGLEARIAHWERGQEKHPAAIQPDKPENGALYPLFITLTIPNVAHIWDDEEQKSLLDKIILEPFRRARETARRRKKGKIGKLWSLIAGGVWTFEITYSKKKGYHPHIHMVVLSRVPFIARQAVLRMWERYIPGVTQADVRKRDRGEALKDLLKYIAKPIKDLQDQEGYREIALATRGRRMINTFGALRNLKAAHLEEALAVSEDSPQAPQANGQHILYGFQKGEYVPISEFTRPATLDNPIRSVGERTPDYAAWGQFDRAVAQHGSDMAAGVKRQLERAKVWDVMYIWPLLPRQTG